MKRIAALSFLAVLAGGCIPKSSTLPHPLDGQTRYLCCNLHYEQPTVADVNYQVGALVPVGTRVTVTKPSGTTSMEVAYVLRRSGERWSVVDIVTDGVSLVSNYRYTFHEIHAKDGIDGVIARLQAQLEPEG